MVDLHHLVSLQCLLHGAVLINSFIALGTLNIYTWSNIPYLYLCLLIFNTIIGNEPYTSICSFTAKNR